ncbi:PREDICTED: programmed cell death 1 ligand 1 isoform X4 [Corvus brachyrhynchos]|uniref:programmed cell death 1 ligand 1 isoform X4 n=1 Tax=Corvus brachyrhynchos TaxID=85066 RepID=UPI000816420B|nr:PREDICTED: programmed cell death 1 ligand 1 isoform X4 [Corvus brachyrhynchos]XP_041868970.1 programmed cell death 1 ligand 1-like isoform X4 [Corvus kubaryi]
MTDTMSGLSSGKKKTLKILSGHFTVFNSSENFNPFLSGFLFSCTSGVDLDLHFYLSESEKLNTAADFLRLEEICSIYTMGRPLVLYIFLFYWHFLNALFTVEAPQSLYTVEHGSNVTMECTFPVNGKLKFRDLSVSWEKKDELKQVYELVKGEEHFKNQHSDFRGRIKLLKENLNLGQSLLQITDVKLRDAGVYRCVIAYEGADYKTIHLKVKAPYRIINQGVGSTGHNEWKLTCQSEGYPEAKVIWQNRDYDDLTDKANTRYETGSDQLYRVTSTLTIKSGIDEVFYCIFWNKELQENTTGILHIAARANRGNRTPVASSSIANLSKDKDTHDCRDASFEDRELKYMQIEKT